MPKTKRTRRSDALMRECYLLFWHPESIDPDTGRPPDWRTAASAVEAKLDKETVKEGCCRATLYKAKDWALKRGLPIRRVRAGTYKLDPFRALAMCQEIWGEGVDTSISVAKICKRYGVSPGAAYRNYRPRYESGELRELVAKLALKRGHSSSSPVPAAPPPP